MIVTLGFLCNIFMSYTVLCTVVVLFTLFCVLYMYCYTVLCTVVVVITVLRCTRLCGVLEDIHFCVARLHCGL